MEEETRQQLVEFKKELLKRGFLTAVENTNLKTPLEKYEYVVKVIKLVPEIESSAGNLLRNLQKECLLSGVPQEKLDHILPDVLLIS